MMRLASIAALVSAPFTLLQAQYPLVRTMTAMDGQQSVHATCLAQDAQGLLWLGSTRGLFRTDGDRTDPVLRTESDAVLALCAGEEGVLAALASGAVLRCDGSGCDTLWSDTLYRSNPVRSLIQDGLGGIWAGTYGGGVHIWREGALFRLTAANGLNDAHVNAQCLAGPQHVAIATDQGIAIADLQGRVVAKIGEQQGATDNLVLALHVADGGRVVAGTDRGGAFSFDPVHAEEGVHVLDSTWAGGAVARIASTAGRIWMGVAGEGTVVCDLSQGLAYYRPTGSGQGAGTQVLDFLLGNDGAVWWCDGSSILRRADVDVLVTPEHERVDMRGITAIAPGPGNRIAFASGRGVFIHANTFQEDHRLQRFQLPVDSSTRPVSLLKDTDGALWAGTFGNGVFRIFNDGPPRPFIGTPVPLNDNVLSIHDRNDTVWFATLDGLYRHTKGPTPTGVTTKMPIPGSGFTYDVLPLADGAVLVATDGNGVIRVERDGTARILPGAGSGHRTFYSLCADGDGHAWACGPSTGIYRVERDRMVAVAADAGAVMSDVYSLTFFAGRLFIFGDGGAFVVDPASGRTDEMTSLLGLRGAKGEMNAATTDAQGSLWIATEIGLFRLSPGFVQRGAGVQASITGVRQGAEELPIGVDAQLPADHDFITFRFTGIHYDAPEDIRFAYRLIGTDTLLRTTRDRELTFSHLAPGSYRFEVYAFSGRRVLDAVADTFSFTVASPWWQRPWAIGLGVALLALMALSAVRVRDGRLRARDRMEKAQAEMEREKVGFQMQVLRSQVNPHFLFNSFNTLIGLIEEAPDKAVKHVEQLSDFFREILQVRDRELIPLRDELRMVDTYFFLEQRRFGERICLQTRVAENSLDAEVPPLTVQLLVENALKHNRATDAEPLVITIATDGDMLTVSNPFRPRESAVRSTGFGIDSIRQRFAAITPRKVSIGRENGIFVARLPLIRPAS